MKLALRCKVIADYIMCLNINREKDFLIPQFLYMMKNNHCLTAIISVKNYICLQLNGIKHEQINMFLIVPF